MTISSVVDFSWYTYAHISPGNTIREMIDTSCLVTSGRHDRWLIAGFAIRIFNGTLSESPLVANILCLIVILPSSSNYFRRAQFPITR